MTDRKEEWRAPDLNPCACSQLRRTARAVSNFYDEILAPAGLTVTQYALLVSVARANGINRTDLAAKLGMDRTTLTRNLGPLENQNLVEDRTGVDRRARQLRLTRSGISRLNRAFLLWQRAQDTFLTHFGQKQFQELQVLLQAASGAVKSSKVPQS